MAEPLPRIAPGLAPAQAHIPVTGTDGQAPATTIRYFLLWRRWASPHPTGVFREVSLPADHRLEYYDPHQHAWVLDSDLARYLILGEPGAVPTTAEDAEAMVQRLEQHAR